MLDSRRWRCLCVGCIVVLLGACGSRVELLSQVSESQANDVIAALAGQGISAEKVSGKEGAMSVAGVRGPDRALHRDHPGGRACPASPSPAWETCSRRMG